VCFGLLFSLNCELIHKSKINQKKGEKGRENNVPLRVKMDFLLFILHRRIQVLERENATLTQKVSAKKGEPSAGGIKFNKKMYIDEDGTEREKDDDDVDDTGTDEGTVGEEDGTGTEEGTVGEDDGTGSEDDGTETEKDDGSETEKDDGSGSEDDGTETEKDDGTGSEDDGTGRPKDDGTGSEDDGTGRPKD